MIQFDCHAHVYETTNTLPGARYAPRSPAPLSSWLQNLKSCGLSGGVLVQVSFLGSDNTELCKALSQLDKSRFAGVAVVSLTNADDTLDDLVSQGVRGVRWNLVRDKQIPEMNSPIAQSFMANLRQRGLHLEVHLEGPKLAPQLGEWSDQGVPIVIDHFGLPSESTPSEIHS